MSTAKVYTQLWNFKFAIWNNSVRGWRPRQPPTLIGPNNFKSQILKFKMPTAKAYTQLWNLKELFGNKFHT